MTLCPALEKQCHVGLTQLSLSGRSPFAGRHTSNSNRNAPRGPLHVTCMCFLVYPTYKKSSLPSFQSNDGSVCYASSVVQLVKGWHNAWICEKWRCTAPPTAPPTRKHHSYRLSPLFNATPIVAYFQESNCNARVTAWRALSGLAGLQTMKSLLAGPHAISGDVHHDSLCRRPAW